MMIMSLKGGLPINQFARVSGIGRYAGGQAPYGRKVRFLNRGGYVSELEEAQQHFKEGDILTIKEIYVDSYISYVEFVEVPSVKFNTVMFADIEE